MAVLEIRQYPDPVLRKKTKRVEEITPEIVRLIDDMVETMYAAPGVGLAAPQVGISLRLAVIDVSSKEDPPRVFVLINPEFLMKEGEVEEEEGCLSVDDCHVDIRRFEAVKVRALDREGNGYEVEAGGLLARALQHEIDHLDGILILDHMSPLKRDLFKRKLRKARKEGTEAS